MCFCVNKCVLSFLGRVLEREREGEGGRGREGGREGGDGEREGGDVFFLLEESAST